MSIRQIIGCIALCSMLVLGQCSAEEMVYQTDFTRHYFDKGVFKIGALADDGWETPQGNPAQIIPDGGGGQLVQGSGYNVSSLNLAAKSARIYNKVATIRFKKAWHLASSSEPFGCNAFSGLGADRKSIGAVVFTSGSEKGGLVTLVGEGTFQTTPITTAGGQNIEWKIDLVNKTMSLSVDGDPATVTSFKDNDTSISTLDSLDFFWGNDVMSQVEDLSITATPADGSAGQVTKSEPLQVGSVSADVLNGQVNIFHNGTLVLRDQVDGLADGAVIQSMIQGTDIRRRGFKWESGGKSFKKIVILKNNEVIIEYLADIDSEQKIPDWSISLFLSQAKWGKIEYVNSGEGCPNSVLVGNKLELQVGEGYKVVGHYTNREPYWKANIQSPVKGEYSLVQTKGSAEDPGHLRAAVRLVFDGTGREYGAADGGFFDRGNPAGNLNQIVDRHFIILASRDRKYCFLGEKVNVTLKYISDDAEHRRIPIEYSMVDAWGKQIDYGVFIFDVTKGDSHVMTFSPKEYGVYRWHFKYTWDTVKRENEAVFAVMPKLEDKKTSDTRSILGAHLHVAPPYLNRLWNVMGMQWNRWWDTGGSLWAEFESEEGKHDFSKADAHWQSDQSRGASTLAVLPQYYFPQWANEKMGILDPNTTRLQRENPEEYAKIYSQQYVKPVVEHFKGKIKYWETANESWWQFNGFEKDYIPILKQSYEVIKEVDSSNQVIGICGYSQEPRYFDYLRNLFKLGALKYLDILSIHFYLDFYPERKQFGICAGDELILRKWIQDVRLLMREYGEEKPLWDTESMIAPYGNMYTVPSQRQNFFPLPIRPGEVYGAVDTPTYAAANVVKLLAIHFIENVKWFYYIFYTSCHASSFCEYDGTPLAMGVAWTQFAKEMDGAKYVEDINISKEVQAYLFERAGKPIVMLWGSYFKPDDAVMLKTQLKPNQVIIRDLLGNLVNSVPVNGGLSIKVTVNPIYLIGKEITSKELKAELERKDIFSWP